MPTAKTNKYGLPREIPEDIKRAVRQASGFGCVICGLSLYQYDHIDPPWAEARQHRPEDICLLCPNDHERKTKGLLSIEDIRAAYGSPAAKSRGYSRDPEFRTCRRPLTVRLGNVVFNDPGHVLRIAGQDLLAVEDLEEGRVGLSGRFFDRKDRLILEIARNEWRTFAGNWDVERSGKSILIREEYHRRSLRVIAESANAVTFDDIATSYLNVGFESKEGEFFRTTYKGRAVVEHRPSEPHGGGLETAGVLNIDEQGQVQVGPGPTTIGSGTIRIDRPG